MNPVHCTVMNNSQKGGNYIKWAIISTLAMQHWLKHLINKRKFSAYLTYLLNSQSPCSMLFRSSVRWGGLGKSMPRAEKPEIRRAIVKIHYKKSTAEERNCFIEINQF